MTSVSRETFFDFLKKSPWEVSRETAELFDKYHDELIKWQHTFNLISKNTIKDIWERHFLDSAQLINYIPCNTSSIIDLGSGAGFPGMINALITGIKTVLLESNHKKTSFLNHIQRLTQAPVEVLNHRIETQTSLEASIVTARALTSLANLLNYSYPLLNSGGTGIFLKGEGWESELEQASLKWSFASTVKSSITNPKSVVISIKGLKRKTFL